jgi:hypothetical protein
MTRFALVIACLLFACFQAHPAGQRELSGEDCYGCHVTDYEATAAPSHRGSPQVYTTTCVSCHRMTGWKPALEGQHSDVFIIKTGDHNAIACQDCHDLESVALAKRGADTNCLTCHPDTAALTASHAGVTVFAGRPYTYQFAVPNFCLECHPAGLAELHPESEFARRGDHAVPCSECHDRAAGSDEVNVTCIESRCHHTVRETDDTDGHKGGDYRRSRGDGTDRDFCHECH